MTSQPKRNQEAFFSGEGRVLKVTFIRGGSASRSNFFTLLSVADLGKGYRGPGPPPPLIFRPNWGPNSLRTADAFPVVASLPAKNSISGRRFSLFGGREATTGNASAVRRLRPEGPKKFFLRPGIPLIYGWPPSVTWMSVSATVYIPYLIEKEPTSYTFHWQMVFLSQKATYFRKTPPFIWLVVPHFGTT